MRRLALSVLAVATLAVAAPAAHADTDRVEQVVCAPDGIVAERTCGGVVVEIEWSDDDTCTPVACAPKKKPKKVKGTILYPCNGVISTRPCDILPK